MPMLDPMADVDLGVVFAVLPEISARRQVYSPLYNGLAEWLPVGPLDLSFLQEGHSVFQSRAILGTCLYAQSLTFRYEYEENVLRRAADFAWVLRTYQAERMAELQTEVGD